MIQNSISLPEPSIQEALKILMKYYPYNYHERAKTEMDILLKYCEEQMESDSQKFLSLLFIQALKNYLSPGENMRLKFFDEYYMKKEELYSLFYEHFPLINFPLDYANKIIKNKVMHDTEMVLIDIGIGTGVQIQRLIEKLVYTTKIWNITIIGIEPNLERLTKCQRKLIQLETILPISIRFLPINDLAEEVSIESIRNIISGLKGKLIINASFALHHIVKSKHRNQLLKSLKGLNPDLLLITEPNTDHQEKDFFKRFQNSYTHFYHLFNIIDNLSIEPHKQNAMKLYFEKEINAIIGSYGRDHNKRYETANEWVNRLKAAGFNMLPAFINHPARLKPDIRVHYKKNGFLAFENNGETLLAMMAAR